MLGQELSIDQFGNDTTGFLSALQIKASVLGWSIEGYVAQTQALTYPNKADKL
jgi:pimeloyl-ACP methyl ester carboxylesterase